MPHKPEYTTIDLCDTIKEVVVSQIVCTECREKEELGFPDHQSAEIWFDRGWRGDRNGAYCPDCSVKLKLI